MKIKDEINFLAAFLDFQKIMSLAGLLDYTDLIANGRNTQNIIRILKKNLGGGGGIILSVKTSPRRDSNEK